jgi:hypothetical protein
MNSALLAALMGVIMGIITLVFICKRTQQRWFYVFICFVVLMQFFSLIYHMYVWENYDLFHVALDHESYYFPKDVAKFYSTYKRDYFSITLLL